MMEGISKALKVLMVLDKLGKSGTANILDYYKRKYKNDTMNRMHIAVILNYYNNWNFVRKEKKKRFWGFKPQVYEITKKEKPIWKIEACLFEPRLYGLWAYLSSKIA